MVCSLNTLHSKVCDDTYAKLTCKCKTLLLPVFILINTRPNDFLDEILRICSFHRFGVGNRAVRHLGFAKQFPVPSLPNIPQFLLNCDHENSVSDLPRSIIRKKFIPQHRIRNRKFSDYSNYSGMEYLAPEHQDLARKGLDGLRVKLPTPQEDVIENLKSNPEEFAFHRGFRVAKEYSNRCLPTASIIWEYLLGKTENKQQKFAVMDKLFHVQIATGPWNIALETAKNLFNETMAYSLDRTTGQSEESLGTTNSFFFRPFLFEFAS